MNKLTKDEILVMPAGREMDVLIAQKVMGINSKDFIWKRYGKPDAIQDPDYGGPLHYSTDITAAWEVVEKLHSCFIDHTAPELGIDVEFVEGKKATADNVALAICRAALLAVMKDDDGTQAKGL